jgi:hypothetical protein
MCFEIILLSLFLIKNFIPVLIRILLVLLLFIYKQNIFIIFQKA